jgi:hypothetical protein
MANRPRTADNSRIGQGSVRDPCHNPSIQALIPQRDQRELGALPVGPPQGYVTEAQYRSAAGEAMKAIAALQVPLTSPRCGLMQSPTLPNVAVGQN